VTTREYLPDALHRLSRASGQQLLLRLGGALCPLAFVAVVSAAGGHVGPAMGAVLVVLTVVTFAMPDSHAGLALMAAMVWAWAVSVPEATSWWTLAAALLLLAVHLALMLTAYGPPELVLEPALLRLWGARAAVLAAATALAWVAARVLTTLDLPPDALLTAVALAVLLGWLLGLTVRLAQRDHG
jgi:hypothetical protein